MTKADLVAEIARKTGFEREEVSRMVEAFMDTIKSSLLEGNHYELRGFGTFQVRKRASKVARNITKNESMVIPERLIPVFKPSKKFTDLFLGINKKGKK